MFNLYKSELKVNYYYTFINKIPLAYVIYFELEEKQIFSSIFFRKLIWLFRLGKSMKQFVRVFFINVKYILLFNI